MVKKMASMHKARKSAPAAGGPQKPRVTMFMTLRDGLSELIDTLTSRLEKMENTVLRKGAPVSSIENKDGKYTVRLESGENIDADAVVVAAPAWAASNLVKGIDAGLSEKLLTIPYVSTATVSIAFKKKDVKHPLNGFGFVVPKIEKRRIMAATWTSVKFAHRAPDDSVLIRCFVGGSKNAELVGLDDAAMVKMVKEELGDIMGIQAEPILTRVFRWKNSMPQYTIGHEERISWIDERVASIHGLYLTGSAYHGIGISDSIRYGEVVAKKIIHQFEKS